MTTYLLDANVVIALTIADHEHHQRANAWMGAGRDFATCPIVEGALVRFVLRLGETAGTATTLLERVGRHPRRAFWPDSLSYSDVDLSALVGHRQVTDAYLVELARRNGGRLATLDEGLAGLHRDAVLIPDSEQ